MATKVLFRDIPSNRYTQVGATGNRSFSMKGAYRISQGGIVCRGFMQYVHLFPAYRRLTFDRSFRYSNSGFPILNLDIGFSAFLESGPAIP